VVMAMNITLEEASTNLLAWLEQVDRGEEITILKEGRAIARLVPPFQPLPPRVPGTAAGLITIAPDFDDPLPDDILEAFET
jgi:antitoxin (DNA-binding transcriptional repressor) of toxin-antitoxin stability system